MEVNKSKEGDVCVLELKGRLDGEQAQVFEDSVMGCLEEGEEKLLFDFGGLDYINSSGLRVLVMAYQRMKESGGRVSVCNIKDYIQEIFEISGYDKIFKLHPSRENALSEFS